MGRLLILITACFMATSAAAQNQQCAPYDVIKTRLDSKYSERQVFSGTMQANRRVEIWANDQTQTWTALVIHPNAIACLVASGKGLNTLTPIGIAL